MYFRLFGFAIVSVVAVHLLMGCVSAGQSNGRVEADAAAVARLLDEAVVLREEGDHESSSSAVGLALRIAPEHPLANELWEEIEQERYEKVQQYLRDARQSQLDQRYGESVRALERAHHLDPGNPAVEALAEIISDIISAQSYPAYNTRDSATTESGQGIRWAWYDDPVSSIEELELAILRTIPRQRIHSYCEKQPAESVSDPINVRSSSMPIFLRDEDAIVCGQLFEDDESLGDVKWYAYSCGSVYSQTAALWAYVVWRDDGDERWVLKRGMASYDPAVSPASYAGATPIGDREDRYDTVITITGD